MRWITIAAFLCCMTTLTTLAAADELANSLNRKELFRIQGKILTNVPLPKRKGGPLTIPKLASSICAEMAATRSKFEPMTVR